MRKPIVIAIIALLASLSVHAQTHASDSVRYRWHDASGLVHFSDSLTREAMKYGYDLINDRGMVMQHVARQLTPEERVAANKLAAEQAAKQRAAQQVADAEAQMMVAYPDEASYRIFQQQTLDSIDQQIHTTQINLRSQETAMTALLANAAAIQSDKKPVPQYLNDRITKQGDVVSEQRNTLQRLQALRAQTVQLQIKQLARYRELKAAQAQPSD